MQLVGCVPTWKHDSQDVQREIGNSFDVGSSNRTETESNKRWIAHPGNVSRMPSFVVDRLSH